MSSGAAAAAGVSPGEVPVYYGGGTLMLVDGKVKVVELLLRCVACGLGLAAALLVGTATQVKDIFTIEKRAKFTDMKALVFLVVANSVAAVYSLAQCLRCALSISRGSVLFNKALAWAIFVLDQAIAYAMTAALAAVLQSAVFAEKGMPELQWMRLCNLYGRFCTQSGWGVAATVAVSLCSVALSCISSFNLFRLYGKGKGKGGQW